MGLVDQVLKTGSMRERWIGVVALLIGILLSATGSVLSSLG